MRSSRPAILTALALAASVGLLAQPAAAATVLLLAADDPVAVGDVEAALLGTGQFLPGELTLRADTSTPAAGELAAHDVALVWSDDPWDDPEALGDALAAYVAAGGRVVLAAHAMEDFSAPGGLFAAAGLSPLLPGPSGPVAGDIDPASIDPAHPLYAGVALIGFPDAGQGSPSLAPGATALGMDSAGNEVAASLCDRAVLALNVFPPDLALPPPTTMDDMALLFANAITTTLLSAGPVAAVDGPWTVDEGGSATIDGSGSSPGDLGPIDAAWDIDGDGVFGDLAGLVAVLDAAALDGPASFSVALRVTDACGRTSEVSSTVTVSNVDPVVLTVSNGGPVVEGSPVTLTATGSDVAGDEPLSWTWAFGDGATAVGAVVLHTYAEDGLYSATATAEDGDGGSAGGSTFVTVTNADPVLGAISHDGPRPEGGTVAFSVPASDPGGLADPLTYAWTFGDGATGSGATPTHVYAEDGVYTVTVLVEDDDGGAATTSTSVTITNVAPALGPILHDAPRPEASTVSFSVTATDPGGSADPLTVTWDFGDGTTADGFSVTHVYADDGVYLVSVRVEDDEGDSDVGSASVTITNSAPVFGSLTHDAPRPEASSVSFSMVATDAAGAADPLTFAWDFGDGGSAAGAAASHAYQAPGTYTARLTVDDGDGGTDTRTLAVSVSNPGPSLSVAPLAPVPEGTSLTGSATASDTLGGAVTLRWDWGDGTAPSTGLALLTPSHVFGDDGPYTVTVTATDTFGGVRTTTVPATVTNVAPIITTSPTVLAVEGSAYTVGFARLDPAGSADPPSWSLAQGPAGAAIHAGTGVLTWTPDYTQSEAGAHSFTVSVSDGDGGSDAVSWSVDPDWADVDGDGLPDSWESLHGLDPGVDDSADDPDGDGLTNLDEYHGGTDPQGNNAPGPATLVAPLGGDSVFTVTPTLQWDGAIDPDGDAVTHTVEVYADAQLTALLASGSGLGAGGPSAWTVPTPLPEDAVLWWRVRGTDGIGQGPFTAAESFFVDGSNSAPSVPAPLSPFEQTVTVPLPTFVTGPVGDPEGDEIVVTIRVFDAAGLLFEAVDALEQGDGTWSGASSVPLGEDLAWSWTAEATDDRGASDGPSAPTGFVVDLTNSAPTPLAFLAPTDDSVVSNGIAVTVLSGTDSDEDSDPLFVRVQVDVEQDFIGLDRQDLGPAPASAGAEVELVVPLPLPENRFVWLRGRTEDDRGGASAWTSIRVFVDGTPEAPGPCTIVAPQAEQEIAGDDLTVRWTPAVDPEAGPMTYAIELYDQGSEDPLWTASGLLIDGTEGLERPDVPLDAGAWQVRVRATDGTGLDGPWSPFVRFLVLPEAGTPFDLGPGEGVGCTCATGGVGRGAGWLILVGTLGAVRRRRVR